MSPLSDRNGRRIGFVLLAIYAIAWLSVDVTGDWRRLHEDNGAMHTTFALAHLHLGLAETRGHDIYYDPSSAVAAPYGHHPPGTGLLLALAFWVTGSAAPVVARLVVIAFHLGTLALLVRSLRWVSMRAALYGGFLIATLPMSWYFGRMVNYEPIALFGVGLSLTGWIEARRKGSRAGLVVLAGGIVFGGLVDWSIFFFAAAIAGFELYGLVRGGQRDASVAATVLAASTLVLGFDLWHLWWATGSLGPLTDVALDPAYDAPSASIAKFVTSQLETCRHYFTHTGLVSALLVAAALVMPRGRLAGALFDFHDAAAVRRLLAVAGTAGGLYILAAPAWAAAHAYWQMYLLPFIGFSMVLVLAYVCRRAATERGWKILLALIVIDIVATTSYTFSLRYFDTAPYAIETTEHFRANYLTPEHVRLR